MHILVANTKSGRDAAELGNFPYCGAIDLTFNQFSTNLCHDLPCAGSRLPVSRRVKQGLDKGGKQRRTIPWRAAIHLAETIKARDFVEPHYDLRCSWAVRRNYLAYLNRCRKIGSVSQPKIAARVTKELGHDAW